MATVTAMAMGMAMGMGMAMAMVTVMDIMMKIKIREDSVGFLDCSKASIKANGNSENINRRIAHYSAQGVSR
jgi:hypothetical protein